jgi:hypothetical protein
MKLRDSQWGWGGMRLQAVAIGFAGLGIASSAFPQWMDGDDLLRICGETRGGRLFPPGICSGYLMATIDLAEGLKAQGVIEAPLFCMPADVTMGTVKEQVIGHAQRDPARKNTTASMLILKVLQKTYPCE